MARSVAGVALLVAVAPAPVILAALVAPGVAQAQTEPNISTAMNNWSVANKTFLPGEGDVVDGCAVAGTTRKLLRFNTYVENWGNNVFAAGPIPPSGVESDLFEWTAGHHHHHLRDFFTMPMFAPSAASTSLGTKYGFCLMDLLQLIPGAPSQPGYSCSPLGTMAISPGWADVYGAGLPCQFVDITGLADGNYLVTGRANNRRNLSEANVYDNAQMYRVNLAGYSTPSVIAPDWQPSVIAVPAVGSTHRPAIVARSENKWDVFWRGTDGKLYTRWRDWSGTWAPGNVGLPIFDPAVPYRLIGGPAAYSAKWNWIDVFGRNSNSAIYHFYWRGGAWGYYSMGGTAGGPPAAVAPSPDRGLVGVIWSDGSFRYRYWNGSSWSPSWVSLGGTFQKTYAPVLVASGWNTVHAFVKNANNSISYRRFTNGSWTPSWENLGGNALGSIAAASRNVNRVDVVYRGTDNKLWRKMLNGGSFGGWDADTGAELVSAPTIISTRPDRLDIVYYRNSGGTTFYRRRHWDGSAWSVDDPSAIAGISAVVPPIAASWADGSIAVFHQKSNGEVRIREKR